ncbi:hypothetical protein [Bradyrhizobium sp. USDA 4353]
MATSVAGCAFSQRTRERIAPASGLAIGNNNIKSNIKEDSGADQFNGNPSNPSPALGASNWSSVRDLRGRAERSGATQ